MKIIEVEHADSPHLREEDWEVDPRLIPFGVTREDTFEIVRGGVAARADAVQNDPIGAAGQFAYIFGTRFLRALFRPKGWLLHREAGIESVAHPDRPLRVVYQSVDRAAILSHIPQAVSGKGSGADSQIDAAQGDMFQDELIAQRAAGGINTGVWFLCVSVNGDDDVCAELSLPSGVAGGNFEGFIERIFVVRPGEWAKFTAKKDGNGDAAEFEPKISRK